MCVCPEKAIKGSFGHVPFEMPIQYTSGAIEKMVGYMSSDFS